MSRIEASQVWVCWRCNEFDDLFQVGNLSAEGLLIQAPKPKVRVGMTGRVDFLVPEGRIWAEAIVRHVELGGGVGMQFTAVNDRPLLRTLIARLRSA